MEQKKNDYELKLDLYKGEKIIKVLSGSDEEQNFYNIILHTNYNRFIVIDIKE